MESLGTTRIYTLTLYSKPIPSAGALNSAGMLDCHVPAPPLGAPPRSVIPRGLSPKGFAFFLVSATAY